MFFGCVPSHRQLVVELPLSAQPPRHHVRRDLLVAPRRRPPVEHHPGARFVGHERLGWRRRYIGRQHPLSYLIVRLFVVVKGRNTWC